MTSVDALPDDAESLKRLLLAREAGAGRGARHMAAPTNPAVRPEELVLVEQVAEHALELPPVEDRQQPAPVGYSCRNASALHVAITSADIKKIGQAGARTLRHRGALGPASLPPTSPSEVSTGPWLVPGIKAE